MTRQRVLAAALGAVALVALLCAATVAEARRAAELRNTRTRSATAARDPAPQDFYFGQVIDHFDPLSVDTFAQRYWANLSMWDEASGPIFFVFAGEAPLEDFYGVQSGFIVDMAREASAAVLYLEHRYYGQSIPAGDFTTESMALLSVSQALADAAIFLEAWMYENNAINRKVIVFGCSYSGALASYFRTRYPHIAFGAVGGSAPLLAQEDFVAYDETVVSTLGPQCSGQVRDAFNQVNSMAQTAGGLASLRTMFNLCETTLQPVNVVYALSGFIMDAVQYDNADTGYPATQLCNAMGKSGSSLQALALYIQQQQQGQCLATDFITPLKNTTTSANYQGSRSWWFQKCTEFGFFKDNSGAQLFSPLITLDWHRNVCLQVFGLPLRPRVFEVNAAFGAQQPVASNIAYTNGELDPWANLGMHAPFAAGQIVALYKGGHCAPFHDPTAVDPESLLAARAAVRTFVQGLVVA